MPGRRWNTGPARDDDRDMQRAAVAGAIAIVVAAGPARADEPDAGVVARPSARREAAGLGILGGTGLGLIAAAATVALATRFDDHATWGYVPEGAAGGGLVGIAATAAALDGLAALWPGRPRPQAAVTIALGERWIHVPAVAAGHGAGGAIELRRPPCGAPCAGIGAEATVTLDAAGGYRGGGVDGAVVVARGRWQLGGGALVEASRVAPDAPNAVPVAAFATVARDLGDLVGHAGRPIARLDLGAGAIATTGSGIPTQWRPLLIVRARVSAWIGGTEVALDYDHRKDGVPGGIYVGKAPGFLGSAGIVVRHPFGRIAARAGGRIGTGWTTWLGLDVAL